MKRYGLKLWSINKNYINAAKSLYEKNIYDYIELYAVPNSFDEYAALWKNLNIPYIIHAPHFLHGLNFSNYEQEKENIRLAYDALKFADFLNAEKVIFHPGIKGDYKETARQINLINDERMLIENKPKNVAVKMENLKSDDICVGYDYTQISYILENTNARLCLDIGHATCAANSMGIDYKLQLEDFIKLNPYMYHISDGDILSGIDKHYHIGSGSYDFNTIFSLIPKDAVISIETEKNSKDNLDDFIEDVNKLKSYN